MRDDSLVTEIDHLVIAAADLPSGVAWLEERLNVSLDPGGSHQAMGTHNALLRLGKSCYLEVIAINPDAPTIDRKRWFDLDSEMIQKRLRQRPRLIHWVARTPQIEVLTSRCPEPIGEVTQMSRGQLQWQITIPEDGRLACDGLIPSLIQWPEGEHPISSLPYRGCRLKKFSASCPDPERIEQALSVLGLSGELELKVDSETRLIAEIETPAGVALLD